MTTIISDYMKNIYKNVYYVQDLYNILINNNNTYKCYSCKEKGLFLTLYSYIDYIDCPICNWYKHSDYFEYYKEANNFGSFQFYKCENCNCLFDTGCEHLCTKNYERNDYHIKIVEKFEYKNRIYYGSPIIELIKNNEEFNKLDLKLYWKCTCKGNCANKSCNGTYIKINECCDQHI